MVAFKHARDEEIIQLFLEYGADPNIADNKRETALFLAVKNYNNNTNVIKLLLNNGGNPNIATPDGTPLLSYAIASDNITVAKLLLQHKADPNIQSTNLGFTALHIAVYLGKYEIIKPLLKHKANLIITDIWGRTARQLKPIVNAEEVAAAFQEYFSQNSSNNIIIN